MGRQDGDDNDQMDNSTQDKLETNFLDTIRMAKDVCEQFNEHYDIDLKFSIDRALEDAILERSRRKSKKDTSM